VDYKTKVSSDAPLGYRVLRATLEDDKGKPVLLQTSFEVAPVVTFSVPDKVVASSSEPQTVKLGVYIHSNTGNRVDGVFRVVAPDGWKVPTGNDKFFMIYESRASKRQVFSLVVPGGFSGTAPIKLIADFAGYHSEHVAYLVVNPNEKAPGNKGTGTK